MSIKMGFLLENSADLDEMQPFILGLHCFPMKVPIHQYPKWNGL